MLKDLRLLSRDRRALVILVAMPMVIIAIVGSSTGRLRANREKSRQGLTIEVADFDQSKPQFVWLDSWLATKTSSCE
jgi:hypothetical protein